MPVNHEPSAEYVAHIRAVNATIPAAVPTASELAEVLAEVKKQETERGEFYITGDEVLELVGASDYDDPVFTAVVALGFPAQSPFARHEQTRAYPLGPVTTRRVPLFERRLVRQWQAHFETAEAAYPRKKR